MADFQEGLFCYISVETVAAPPHLRGTLIPEGPK